MDKEDKAKLAAATIAGAAGGQLIGIGMDSLVGEGFPVYGRPVAVEAAQQIMGMPDVEKMSPAEVNFEMEKRKAAVQGNRGLDRDKVSNKRQKKMFTGLVLGAVVGGGAGYAVLRRRQKKEQEENKGTQKG
ncbi:MAG: hypothetical protein R3D71_08205 [Rickettsiales bacterium]